MLRWSLICALLEMRSLAFAMSQSGWVQGNQAPWNGKQLPRRAVR